MGGNSHNRNAIISCTVNSMSTAITRRKEVYVHPRRDAPVVKRGCYGVHNIFRRVTLANVSLVCYNTHPIAVACSSGVRTKLFFSEGRRELSLLYRTPPTYVQYSACDRYLTCLLFPLHNIGERWVHWTQICCSIFRAAVSFTFTLCKKARCILALHLPLHKSASPLGLNDGTTIDLLAVGCAGKPEIVPLPSNSNK